MLRSKCSFSVGLLTLASLLMCSATGYAQLRRSRCYRPCVKSRSHCRPVTTSYRVVSSGCPQTSSCNPCGAMQVQPQVTYAYRAPCGCASGGVRYVYPQGQNQNAYVVQPDGTVIRSPYSLSGYVLPPRSAGGANPQQAAVTCEDDFLECCRTGGSKCLENYVACSDFTGEPLQHVRCPPVVIDPPGGDGGGPGGGGPSPGGGGPSPGGGIDSEPEVKTAPADDSL
jgi:hypothetical protein